MGTVSKALTLLDYFSRTLPEIGLSELSRLAGMNKATVFRMLSELRARGIVEQTKSGRSYRLGPAVLRLAAIREATVPTRDVTQSVLQSLSDVTGETAHISQVQGDRLATVAYSYASVHGTAVRMEDAEFVPFHATSTGLAILAFGTPALRHQILSGKLTAFTPKTVVDPSQILAFLDGIRATGFAETIGEFEQDVHSLAVPVFDADGLCSGAVAVAAPVARMTPELRVRILSALRDGADQIATLWGGAVPDGLRQVWANAT